MEGLNDLKDDYGVYGERYIRNDRGIMHRLEAFSDGVFTHCGRAKRETEWNGMVRIAHEPSEYVLVAHTV